MIVAAIAIVECLVRWAIVGFGEPNPRRVAQAMGEMLFVYLPAIAACIPLMTAFISFLKSGKAHLTTTPP
jgi:hypothetical protein